MHSPKAFNGAINFVAETLMRGARTYNSSDYQTVTVWRRICAFNHKVG